MEFRKGLLAGVTGLVGISDAVSSWAESVASSCMPCAPRVMGWMLEPEDIQWTTAMRAFEVLGPEAGVAVTFSVPRWAPAYVNSAWPLLPVVTVVVEVFAPWMFRWIWLFARGFPLGFSACIWSVALPFWATNAPLPQALFGKSLARAPSPAQMLMETELGGCMG